MQGTVASHCKTLHLKLTDAAAVQSHSGSVYINLLLTSHSRLTRWTPFLRFHFVCIDIYFDYVLIIVPYSDDLLH